MKSMTQQGSDYKNQKRFKTAFTLFNSSMTLAVIYQNSGKIFHSSYVVKLTHSIIT